MGEIKSTLDLVMERTKNLTMSEGEKEKQHQKKLKQRLHGLIQKVENQAIKLNEFITQAEKLEIKFGLGTTAHILKAVLDGVALNKDNTRCLSLLKSHFELDVSPLSAVMAQYHLVIDDLKNEFMGVLKNKLSDRFQISGTAVIPNIETDPAWREKHRIITGRFQHQLETEKQRMLTE